MCLLSGNSLPPELCEAVNRYLSERPEASVISTSLAARAARASVSGCADVTDQELVGYIAERAVEAGFAVSFDGRELPR